MDTNEEMAVKIVRDCLTTARESLPSYASRLWVREMPVLKFHGTMAAEPMARHALIAAFRVAAMRSRHVDLTSDYAPDVRITRVLLVRTVLTSTVRLIPDMLTRWCACHCGTPPFSARYRHALWLRLIRALGRIPVGIRSCVIMSISYDASSFTNVANKHIL